MSWVGIVILVIIFIYLASTLYFRFMPIDIAKYDHSPIDAPSDGKPHEYRLIGEKAPVYHASVTDLAKTVDAYITSQPRTKRLAGSTEDQPMTYVQRSFFMGFPDYISVEVQNVDKDHARMNILSRSHYGVDDLGVNKSRIEHWVLGIREKIASKS